MERKTAKIKENVEKSLKLIEQSKPSNLRQSKEKLLKLKEQ